MSVKIAIHTTSTRCQYSAAMSTQTASFGCRPRFMSMANNVPSQITPAVTCAPWKPVSVKNDEPNRFRRIVRPSWTNDVNSYAWKPRNVAPMRQVMNSQSFELFSTFHQTAGFAGRGLLRFSTAASAITIEKDDISSTNVEIDVIGMLRMALNVCPVWGFVHAS